MLDSRVGQSVNIDWTIGLAVFISVLLASLTMMMESNAMQGEVGLDTKLDQIQDNLREETELEGRRLPLVIRTPVELSNVAFDREYVFQESAYPGSGVMDVPAEVNISNDRIRTVVDAEDSSHDVSYFFENVSNLSYSNDLDVGSGWMNNTKVSVKPGESGLESLRINDKELLNDSADISGSSSIKEHEIYAATLDQDLKLYNNSKELILENPDNPVFKLKNLSTLYWHSDGSTTDLAGAGTFKEGTTKGVTVASDYGITFVGDLDANVSKPDGDTVKINISASRIKIRLHDSDYTEGKKRIRFYDEGRMTLGVAEEIKGAYREKIRDLNNLNESELEDKLGLNGVGYNIQYGDTVEMEYDLFSVLTGEDMKNGVFNGSTVSKIGENFNETEFTESNFKQGTPEGSSPDREDNSGSLGIGYLNGTRTGQTHSTELNDQSLAGYWRFDRDVTGSGGTLLDYSGSGNDGTYNGGTTTGKTGVFGTNSSNFDGSNDYVDLGNPEELKIDSSLSICMWINPDNLGAQRENPIHKAYGGEFSFTFEDSNDHSPGTLSTYFGSDGGNNGPYAANRWTNVAQDNEWSHICWIRDNENQEVTLYKNATDWSNQQTSSEWETPTTGSNNAQIGNGYTNNFDGKIDEVRIYNQSLSPSKIKKLYFEGLNGKFYGNYTSKKIDNDEQVSWESLEIDASIPSDTSLTAKFKALDSGGTVQETEFVEVEDGKKNYTLDVQNTEDAEIEFNGTSSNLTKTWEVEDLTVYKEVKNTFNEGLRLGYFNGTDSGESYETGLNNGDLVGYWRFDRNISGNGGTAPDYSGNQNDGTTNNGVETGVKGILGTKSFRFDGSSNEVSIPDDNSLDFSDGESFSITSWIKIDSEAIGDGDFETFISKGSWDSPPFYGIQTTDTNVLRIPLQDASSSSITLDSTSTMEADKWYHITATYDGSQASLYINGILNNTHSANLGSFEGGQKLFLGLHNRIGDGIGKTQYWDGKIDEARIYSRELSDNEVKKLYFKGSDGEFKGNYTSERIKNNREKSWNNLEVNVSELPSDTSVSADFNALDKSGNIVDDQLISLSSGLNNYSLDLQKTKDAQVIFEGSTSNVTKTWKISSFKAYYSGNQSSNPLLNKGQSLPPQNVYAVETSFPFMDRYGSFSELNGTVRLWE